MAPLDPASERAIAVRAGELAASLCGMQPPLQFERALLAEADGRFVDALSDLKQLLGAYPGFVAASIAAGRIALACGDAAGAIRSLAPVEGEITHTRDGAALLADAARTIGLHQSASRYDLAALVCRGGYDSHGNDCAPIDLGGKIADDERMPQSLYLEGQNDGSVLCNAGGIYYRVNPFFGQLLSLMTVRGRGLSTMRALGPSAPNRQRWAFAEVFEAATARLRLYLGGRFPNPAVPLRKYAESALSVSRRLLMPVLRLAARIDLALIVFLYRLFRRLPVRVRVWADKVVQSQMTWLRPLVAGTIGPLLGPRGKWRIFSPLSDAYVRGQLVEARYQSGLAYIFGLRERAHGNETTPRVEAFLDQLSVSFRPSADEAALKMPAPGKLPPQAERVLSQLVSEIDTLRSPRPQSRSGS